MSAKHISSMAIVFRKLSRRDVNDARIGKAVFLGCSRVAISKSRSRATRSRSSIIFNVVAIRLSLGVIGSKWRCCFIFFLHLICFGTCQRCRLAFSLGSAESLPEMDPRDGWKKKAGGSRLGAGAAPRPIFQSASSRVVFTAPRYYLLRKLGNLDI